MIRGKRILITAGPTWVPIDKVRVISNTATGETGILLADKLENLGAQVTLLRGPVAFEELKNKMVKELSSKKYDIVIHSAAVSDYKPQRPYAYKVRANKKIWQLNLIPTEKLIEWVKKIARDVFLVGFKFEPQTNKHRLIKEAKILMQRSNADLIVANTLQKNKYQAYIVNQKQTYGPLFGKTVMVNKLVKVMQEAYGKIRVKRQD